MIASIAPLILVALLDTPTPTPTPTPFPHSGEQVCSFSVANPSSGFCVNYESTLPWSRILLPTQATPIATPTLYNATAIHATDYPNQVATATAQVQVFTAPINEISTPVAALIGQGPTPVGGELDTGLNPQGTGNVTFTGFAATVTSNISDVVSTGREFVLGLIDVADYSPFLLPAISAELMAVIIGLFLALMVLIVKAGNWLVNLVIRLGTLIGSFIP